MTTEVSLASASALLDGIKGVLLEQIPDSPAGSPFVEVLPKVTAACETDKPAVVAALWDLVHAGKLSYGTDARVRRA